MQTVKRRYREVKSKRQELAALSKALPEFFRARVTVPQAEDEIKRALDRRQENFLELVRSRVYGRPNSPYLKLLKIAGCDFSDLQAQVRRSGLEATLEKLAGEGVYVTSDEFKGKKEIVRSGRSFRVSPEDFEMSESPVGFGIQSSGTTNTPVRSSISLKLMAAQASIMAVSFSAHDLFSCAHGVYDSILPGAGGFHSLLVYSRMGLRVDRWFGRKIPANSRLATAGHYLTSYLIIGMGKRFAPSFPTPEFIDVSQVQRIVQWVSDKKREGRTCCITTAASNAARIARVGWESGVSMTGTKFIMGGEPLTDAKREVVEKVGARAIPRYVYGGCLLIGYGCANPVYTDEIHVDQSAVALIANPRPIAVDGPPTHALLCTTLNPWASKLLFNMDNGDYATFSERSCGCALEKAGLRLHLHRIRSYEKFTSEGMNYFYGDLFGLLERTLPAEFGGGPGDYQLVEEEDANGQTRLTLVVHPQVGSVEDRKLLSRLQDGLGWGSRSNRFQAKIWQAVGTLRVRRAIPHASPRGKILPLHIPR